MSNVSVTGFGTTLRTVAGANCSSSSSRRWVSARPRKSAARPRSSSAAASATTRTTSPSPVPSGMTGGEARRDPDARRGEGDSELGEEALPERERLRPEAEPLAVLVRVLERAREVLAHLDAPRHDDRDEGRLRSPPTRRGRDRTWLGGVATIVARDPAGAGAGDDEEGGGEHEERHRRQAGDEREEEDEAGGDAQRLRHPEELARELLTEGRVGILARDARDEDAGSGGEDERRDLGHEAVADREQAVPLERLDRGHPLLPDADREAAEDVHDRDHERRDDVALHELHRPVHRAVELALARQHPAAPAGLVAVDRA